jgi:hypothetical protein
MRRILPVGLALVGVALAMPVAATAGSPDMMHGLFVKKHKKTKQAAPAPAPPQMIQNEDGQIVQTVSPAPVDHVHTAGVPCTTCEAAAAAPPVIMEGACAACENGATTVHTHPVVEEAPGVASIRPQETPGYARVGGGGATQVPMYAEPTPIGVMQAGYHPQTQQGQYQPDGLQAPVDVLALSEAREKEKRQASAVAPTMGGSPGKPRSRPHILAHLFGFDGVFRLGRDHEDQRASQHAAISYGPMNQVVTDVPASAVYGNGGH